MTPIVPNSNERIADDSGIVRPVWHRFFGALVDPPGAISPVAVSASPTGFTAPGRGTVAISGGTLTAVTLNRAGTIVSLGISQLIPVANADVVTVSYSVAPTISFIPS